MIRGDGPRHGDSAANDKQWELMKTTMFTVEMSELAAGKLTETPIGRRVFPKACGGPS